jgi:hypothetical protein
MKKSSVIYIVASGIVALWFIGQILYPASLNLTHGFGAYYSAARLLSKGQISDSIYDPAYFRPLVSADSHQQADDIYNANPPTTSLMFWPLSFFSIEKARMIWTWANAIMLLGGLSLLIWAFADHSTPITFWTFFSLGMLFQPVIQNIRFGQAYLLLFLVLTMAVVAFQRKQAGVGGGALALALLLKTAGWALLPLLAWQKRWQYLAWTLGITGSILLLTLPLFRVSMWSRYFQLLAETTQSPLTCVTAYQTTRSLLCHIFVFDHEWNKAPIIDLPWLATGLFISLALVTLIVNFKLSRQNQTLAFISIIAWGVIFAPIGEQYHHTVMLIPITWLLIAWQKGNLFNRSGKFSLAAALFLYLVPFQIGHPQFQDQWWALLAYPRVYSAWLVLLAIISVQLREPRQTSEVFKRDIASKSTE